MYFISTFSLRVQRKSSKKKRRLAGAVTSHGFNVAITRAVSCPQTSRHAQCAGLAVILDGFKKTTPYSLFPNPYKGVNYEVENFNRCGSDNRRGSRL